MDEATLTAAARAVLAAHEARGWMIATAESCTGGLIAATLTDVAGSSAVVDRGFVTYSNAAKTDLVGVPADLIARVGAVSEEVAAAMASGALDRAPRAATTIAVTGIAGPGGGSAEKPVGLVWFALATRDGPVRTDRQVFPGDRREVRRRTVMHALSMLLDAAG